jgi:hypothetical protein
MLNKNIDSKVVNKEIKKHIIPLLKEHGFQVFTARSAWRDRENKIDVINFQSFNSFLAEVLQCTTFSFAVNLGVYFKCIPNQYKNSPLKVRSNIICPEEYSCHIRRSLNKTLEQKEFMRNSVWAIDKNGENLDVVISDAARVIESEAFSWFERFENINEVMRTLKYDDLDMDGTLGFGNNPSPIRNYLTGYISLEIGDFTLAASSLKEALDSECFTSEQLTNDYNDALAQSKASKKLDGF